METLSKAIGRALRMELERRDLNAASFALRIGTSKSNLSRWTSGAVDMRTSQLELIANGLGIPASQLVALAESVRQEIVDADPLPAGAFSKGDLDLAADVDPDAKADED